MPRRRGAWASWNYHLTGEPTGRTTVTYHMNRLQSLDADREFLVTLNRTEAIDPDKVIRVIDYAHPVYTPEGSARRRRRWEEISGVRPHPLLRRLLALGLPRGRRLVRASRVARRSAGAGRLPQPDADGAVVAAAASTASGRAGGGRVSASAIYEGWVAHRRRGPVPHAFRYRIFLPLFDLDELPELLDPIPLWSARRPAPARLRRDDYLGDGRRPPRRERPRPRRWSASGAGPAGPVRLLANPRYLGVGFNPVVLLLPLRRGRE